MEHCKAYRIFNENNKIEGRIVDVPTADIGRGEVVFQNAFSSVNFKDALAATGAGGKIIRNYPLIGGIDAAGTVLSSSDARFKAGDEIICTSYDMGVAHDGGYSGFCRVPADWVLPLPKGLSLFEAMALGTAGYTAGLAVELLELNGMTPAGGKVLVNGATGGVASLAIDMLAAKGYAVTAITGKTAEHDYLRELGAAEVLDRAAVDFGTRPLEKPLWAAAFDSVGGDQLGWLTRTMQPHGVIGSFGNAGGIDLKSNVLPFILRGVRLIGVDSVATPMALRKKVWGRLASDLKPRHLDTIAHTISLSELHGYFERMLKGAIRGRAVVRIL